MHFEFAQSDGSAINKIYLTHFIPRNFTGNTLILSETDEKVCTSAKDRHVIIIKLRLSFKQNQFLIIRTHTSSTDCIF